MTAPNTLTNQYLSVMSKTEVCKADFNQIVRNCQPEPDEKTKKEDEKAGIKHKKSTLTTTIKESLKSLDDKGKELAGYKRGKVAKKREDRPFKGNAWIDDHCTGLWVSPFSAKNSSNAELKKFMEEMPGKLDEGLSKLSDNLDSIWTQLDASMELMDEMVGVATDMGMGPVAESIGKKLLAKAAVKGGVGLLGIESVIIPILMALWTIADVAVAINDLASFMGDKGKAFLNTLDSLDNVDEKIKSLAQDLKDNPRKGLTNAMRYAAELNPCIRARKCLLVPYENTSSDGEDDPDVISKKTGKPIKNSKAKSQAKHGQGCCPGQTGHHIMPGSMFKGVDCPGYSYKDAPTMCLEGTSNSAGWGSHGDAHANLKETMNVYRTEEVKKGTAGTPDSITYDEAQKQSIDAVRKEAATQCDPDCLKAQLDDHYKQCKKPDGTSSKLIPSDGGGKFIEMRPKDTGSEI